MKNEQMVGTRIPTALLRDLEQIETAEQADRSTTVRKLLARAVRDWKLEHCAQAYGRGRVTLARAAADAGVTLWEMTSYLQANKIPAQYDNDDLQRDLARIKARRRPKRLVNADDTLTAAEAKKVRHGLKQVREGKTRPWSQVKHGPGL